MSTLFAFFDDYWYYGYHDRNYTLLISTKALFDSIQIISNAKFEIPFVNSTIIRQFFSFRAKEMSNYSSFTPLKYEENASEDIYFLKNTQ